MSFRDWVPSAIGWGSKSFHTFNKWGSNKFVESGKMRCKYKLPWKWYERAIKLWGNHQLMSGIYTLILPKAITAMVTLKNFPAWFRYLCQKRHTLGVWIFWFNSYELVPPPGYYFLCLSPYTIFTVYKQPWQFKILKLMRSETHTEI